MLLLIKRLAPVTANEPVDLKMLSTSKAALWHLAYIQSEAECIEWMHQTPDKQMMQQKKEDTKK